MTLAVATVVFPTWSDAPYIAGKPPLVTVATETVIAGAAVLVVAIAAAA